MNLEYPAPIILHSPLLPGFTIPGDISASNRFWEEDIITPEVTVENGYVKVPSGPGIGFEINEKRLQETIVIERNIYFIKGYYFAKIVVFGT